MCIRDRDHSYARKMMIITTSDHAEEVIGNIMEEKNWDLWITSVAVVDKDMTGWLINEIPVVAHSYRSIFEMCIRDRLPTAAKASLLANRPTTAVPTELKSCCKILQAARCV